MTDTVHIKDQTGRSLKVVRREIPDAQNVDDVIENLLWQYASKNDNLHVELSGAIKPIEDRQTA